MNKKTSKGKKVVLLIIITFFMIHISSFLAAGCSTKPLPKNSLDRGEHPSEESSPLFPLLVKDDLGREVLLPHRPRVIISLVPSHTEILFALGLGEQIAAVTDYCDFPKETSQIEKIGGFADPSLEKIISLDPDLVLGNFLHLEILDSLLQAGIPALAFEPQGFDQVFETIETIGVVTAKEREAKNLLATMKKELRAIKTKIAEIPWEERPSVFFEIWHDPLTTVGSETLLFEMLEMTAGKIISSPEGGRYPLFSIEKLFEENPDFYFATKGSMSDYTNLLEREGWEILAAVKKGQVHIMSDENIIYREGPRIVEGLKEIAEALYPHLFEKE